MNLGQDRSIFEVAYFDETTVDRDLTVIRIGDRYIGDIVRAIDVGTTGERYPVISLVHHSSITVLPDVKVAYYKANLNT